MNLIPIARHLLCASLFLLPAAAEEADCSEIAQNVQKAAERHSVDAVALLEMVDREISAHPSCSCEIVKAAILGSDADQALVGYIVETAIRAKPEEMRLIAQCAMAAAPDSLDRVQEVLNRLDPAGGDTVYSAKSSKAKGVQIKPLPQGQARANPLDRYDFLVPPFIPPVITPPTDTETDF